MQNLTVSVLPVIYIHFLHVYNIKSGIVAKPNQTRWELNRQSLSRQE